MFIFLLSVPFLYRTTPPIVTCLALKRCECGCYKGGGMEGTQVLHFMIKPLVIFLDLFLSMMINFLIY